MINLLKIAMLQPRPFEVTLALGIGVKMRLISDRRGRNLPLMDTRMLNRANVTIEFARAGPPTQVKFRQIMVVDRDAHCISLAQSIKGTQRARCIDLWTDKPICPGQRKQSLSLIGRNRSRKVRNRSSHSAIAPPPTQTAPSHSHPSSFNLRHRSPSYSRSSSGSRLPQPGGGSTVVWPSAASARATYSGCSGSSRAS